MAVKLISRKYCACQDDDIMEFIADTDADLNNLPPCSSTGSTAVSIESGKVKIVNTNGKWVTFGG